MDCLIEKNGVKTELSSLEVLITNFSDSSPTVKASQREVTNRNGFLFSGATFSQKTLTIEGKFQTDTMYEAEEKKDELNALLMNVEPFYITKMLPSADFYEYELPGQSEGFSLLGVPSEAYKYRYKVIADSPIDYEFVGKSTAGVLHQFSVSLKTAELPFGETVPVDEVITDFVRYRGTADCSQLEWPWIIRLTATVGQTGQFTVTVGDRTFESYSPTPLKAGDTFLLKGVEVLKNLSNFNSSTNYEHFVLKPYPKGRVPFITTFRGKIEVLNKTELYK